ARRVERTVGPREARHDRATGGGLSSAIREQVPARGWMNSHAHSSASTKDATLCSNHRCGRTRGTESTGEPAGPRKVLVDAGVTAVISSPLTSSRGNLLGMSSSVFFWGPRALSLQPTCVCPRRAPLARSNQNRSKSVGYAANSASNLSSIQFGKQKDSGGLPCNLRQREARNLFFPSPAAAHWSNCRELPIRRLDTPQRPYGPQR